MPRSEEQLESSIELKTNAADRALMGGRMSQAEYDQHIRELNRWAESQRNGRAATLQPTRK